MRNTAHVVGGDRRMARMVRDPEKYFAEARKRERMRIAEELKREQELQKRAASGR